MDQHSVRKTFKYQLMPTPEQEQALQTVVWHCRELYNAGPQERTAAWEKRGVCVTFGMPSAQLSAIKDVQPDYRDPNAQVLQEVLHALDKAFAAFFRRVQAGENPATHTSKAPTATIATPIHRWACTAVRRWTGDAQPRHDWPYSHPPPTASSAPRHPQDRHHQPGSGWLVCVQLLR